MRAFQYGLEATRRIVHEAMPTRVVILTTFERDDYVFDARRMGASGVLLKKLPAGGAGARCADRRGWHALLAPSVTRKVIEGYVRRPIAVTPVPRTAMPGGGS